MSASAWNDDRIGRLKKLWNEGQTAEQVSRDLGHGITRSAVLGKVYRLGLSAGRATVPAKAPPRPASALPRRDAVSVMHAKLGLKGAWESGSATVQSVGRHQCRWPLGDPADAEFSLCGRPVSRGVYCGPHGEIAYRPVRETAKALERLARLN